MVPADCWSDMHTQGGVHSLRTSLTSWYYNEYSLSGMEEKQREKSFRLKINQCKHCNINKINKKIESGQMIWIDISWSQTCRWPNNYRKDCEGHQGWKQRYDLLHSPDYSPPETLWATVLTLTNWAMLNREALWFCNTQKYFWGTQSERESNQRSFQCQWQSSCFLSTFRTTK